jgi:hypothetical protein
MSAFASTPGSDADTAFVSFHCRFILAFMGR